MADRYFYSKATGKSYLMHNGAVTEVPLVSLPAHKRSQIPALAGPPESKRASTKRENLFELIRGTETDPKLNPFVRGAFETAETLFPHRTPAEAAITAALAATDIATGGIGALPAMAKVGRRVTELPRIARGALGLARAAIETLPPALAGYATGGRQGGQTGALTGATAGLLRPIARWVGQPTASGQHSKDVVRTLGWLKSWFPKVVPKSAMDAFDLNDLGSEEALSRAGAVLKEETAKVNQQLVAATKNLAKSQAELQPNELTSPFFRARYEAEETERIGKIPMPEVLSKYFPERPAGQMLSLDEANDLITRLNRIGHNPISGAPRSTITGPQVRSDSYQAVHEIADHLNTLRDGLGKQYVDARKQFHAFHVIHDLINEKGGELFDPRTGDFNPSALQKYLAFGDTRQDLERALGAKEFAKFSESLRRNVRTMARDIPAEKASLRAGLGTHIPRLYAHPPIPAHFVRPQMTIPRALFGAPQRAFSQLPPLTGEEQ